MSGGRREGDGARHVYRARRRRTPLRVAAVVALVAAVSVAVVAWTEFGRAAGGPSAVASPSPSPARSSPAPGPTRSPGASPSATVGPAAPFAVAAWSRGDVASLRAATAAHALTEVDLDWWHARPDGSLSPEAVDPAFVGRAHAAHLRVFATVTNRANDFAAFDPAIAEAILATPATRAHHVAELVALTEDHGYDGIDVDWESLRAADRASFSAFVGLLAVRLHAAGKLLSVDVYDKTSDYPTGTEAGARAAEDYAALGRAADELKVLTFGEHGSFTGPGPLSSPAWMARVLAYAESQVAPAKIYLGVPFYGFDWGVGSAALPALDRRPGAARAVRRDRGALAVGRGLLPLCGGRRRAHRLLSRSDRGRRQAGLRPLPPAAHRRHRHLGDGRRGPGVLAHDPRRSAARLRVR